jgi:hypothetical protein
VRALRETVRTLQARVRKLERVQLALSLSQGEPCRKALNSFANAQLQPFWNSDPKKITFYLIGNPST